MNIHSVYEVFQRYFRKRRMLWFQSYFNITDTTTILDVGGSQFNWQFLTVKPLVTVVNLTKPSEWDDHLEHFWFEIGDGTKLEFSDESFEIVYSNSVIEHLFHWENQKKFAKEVLRVGKSVFVQTPAKEFIMEPHMVTPIIHWLPLRAQAKLMRHFTVWGIITRPSQEYIDQFLLERRLLSLKEFKQLFSGCNLIKEDFLLMAKSYIAVRKS
ncbi:MAG: hypothetical protein C0410_09180 [Anaerolinea sp.]|nr:hypothetical protein [Anaerolinea sp.]